MTTMTTPAEQVQATELAGIEQHFTTREREIDRAIAAEEQARDRVLDDHVERWVTTDPERFSRLVGYRDACLALQAKLQPCRDHLQTLRGDREFLPHQRRQAVQAVLASVTLGPDIAVPVVTLPSCHDDTAANTLSAKRDAALVDRHAHAHDLAVLESLVPKMEATVADVAVHFQHKLATTAEVERENQRLDALRTSIGEHRRALATLERTIAGLDEAIARRGEAFETERLTKLDAAITRAAFAHADDLVRAMSSSTALRRLLTETGAPRRLWTLDGLDADDPKGGGRELLERCLKLGWQPKT
jgi:hypothetical protein